MLDAIRRWLGATRRERELQAENERLQAEVNKLQDEANDWFRRCSDASRKLDADRGVHERAVAALRDAVEIAVRQRDAARRDRDQHAGRLKAVEDERDAALAELKAACEERDAIHGTRDAFRAEAKRSTRFLIRELRDRHDTIMRRVGVEMSNWSRIASEMIEDTGFDTKVTTDAPPDEEAKP